MKQENFYKSNNKWIVLLVLVLNLKIKNFIIGLQILYFENPYKIIFVH